MSKILLVYEDYAELMSVEAALKKVGFDTIGITHEFSIQDQVISFNPDVVIGCGRSGKVTSLGVGRRLKEMPRWNGKTILIFGANNAPPGPELIKIRSDIILEAPVPPLRLIQVLAKMLGMDEAILLERLNKMIHGDSTTNTGPTFSTVKSSTNKNESVKFVVGGGANEKTTNTVISGGTTPTFNRASENTQSDGEGGKRPSFFTHLKGREDLYRDEVKSGEASEENLFAEVDLKSLESELTGKTTNVGSSTPAGSAGSANVTGGAAGSTTSTSVDGADSTNSDSTNATGGGSAANSSTKTVGGVAPGTSSTTVGGGAPPMVSVEAQASQQKELEDAKSSLKDRVARYNKFLSRAPSEPGQLTRVETRKRQRELNKDWDAEKLKDLDKLRREFTKALYKK